MGRLLLWLLLIPALTRSASAQQPKVALHPMSLPGPIQSVTNVPAMFDSILTAELWEHGYGVVPSAESGKMWKELVDSVQGFYDPISGDTVRAEFEAVRSGTLLHLASAFGATVLLRSSIEVIAADWDRGKAKWDGVSEGVSPTGGGGRVGALTLVIVAEDSAGRVVATGRGGIQVLAKFRGRQYEPVPVGELFADDDRNLKAVQLALRPFFALGGDKK